MKVIKLNLDYQRKLDKLQKWIKENQEKEKSIKEKQKKWIKEK